MSYPQWIRKGSGEVIHWSDPVDFKDDNKNRTDDAQNFPTQQDTPEQLNVNQPEDVLDAEEAPVLNEPVEPEKVDPLPTSRPPRSENARLIRELSRLGTSFNPEATRLADEAKQTEALEAAEKTEDKDVQNMALTLFGRECGMFAASMMEEVEKADSPSADQNNSPSIKNLMKMLHQTEQDEFITKEKKDEKMREVVGLLKQHQPTTYHEAWNHENEMFRDRFRAAIKKELRDMIKRGVWRSMKRRDIPPGRRCVKCRWVFEIKRSGRFRARLVACGYSQVPGIDFENTYAPTINDTSWRILIIAMLLWNLDAKIVDVETAFLMGDLEENIYMDAPQGSGLSKDECVKLEKSMYGLVQAARQYYIKFSSAL